MNVNTVITSYSIHYTKLYDHIVIADAYRSPEKVLRAEAAALRGPNDEPLPPFVDFDALFIPDSHENVVLIAPQLAFHEAAGAVLLGANGWHHEDLVRIAGKHVEGAYYTVHFHGESELAPVREFARNNFV